MLRLTQRAFIVSPYIGLTHLWRAVAANAQPSIQAAR